MRTRPGGKAKILACGKPIELEPHRLEEGTGERVCMPEMLGLKDVYAGVGVRRTLDGKTGAELDHVHSLCQASLGKLRGRGLGEAEWVREVRARCGGVVTYHATACADLALFEVAEKRLERSIRAAHRCEFHIAPGSPVCDLYLTMGWVHMAAEAAAAMYGKVCDALGECVDSPLRVGARSLFCWP